MEDFLEPQIMGLSVYCKPHTTAGGSRVIASFDLHFAGILFRHCALVERAGGGHNAWPPSRAKLGHDSKSEVRFMHGETRRKITAAALAAFQALGGKSDHPEELPAAVRAMLDEQLGERD